MYRELSICTYLPTYLLPFSPFPLPTCLHLHNSLYSNPLLTTPSPTTETYSSQIPRCIEDGEYLLRIQSLAIHNPWPSGIPQFYISCAQISVAGGTGTASPQTALIPGAFKETDPGYTANVSFISASLPFLSFILDIWIGR